MAARRLQKVESDGVQLGYVGNKTTHYPTGYSLNRSRPLPGNQQLNRPWPLLFSLPLMAVEGLPLSLQLQGFSGADALLMAHARWLDEAFRDGLI